jgi:hypothetical protein
MPTTHDALSMNTYTHYRSPIPVPLPETDKKAVNFKTRMIAEASLIGANLKAFIGCATLAALGVADLVTDPAESLESKGIQGALILVVGYLFRLIITERKAYEDKISKLYERIIRNGKDDDDEPKARRARGQDREADRQ